MTGGVPELLETLLEPVWSRQQALGLIYAADGEYDQGARAKRKRLLGLGYETTRSQEAELEGQRVVWE
jgi:hypothetical protein